MHLHNLRLAPIAQHSSSIFFTVSGSRPNAERRRGKTRGGSAPVRIISRIEPLRRVIELRDVGADAPVRAGVMRFLGGEKMVHTPGQAADSLARFRELHPLPAEVADMPAYMPDRLPDYMRNI